MSENNMRPVVVTTAHRGVFIGETDAAVGAEVVVLQNGRNVFRWGAESKGFVGIAAKGLFSGSVVGPAATKLELRNVTAVIDATAEAAATWEQITW